MTYKFYTHKTAASKRLSGAADFDGLQFPCRATTHWSPMHRIPQAHQPATSRTVTNQLLLSTIGRFPLPELTARVDGCQKMHPSSRAVNSARELG